MAGSPVPTICKICDEHCGILAADDGQRVSIKGNREHPISKGFVCVKGKNFGEVHHSPHRLTKPLLKTTSGWEEISFESALDLLASKFESCKKEYGPESTVFFKGEALKHYEIAQCMRHLANGFGSPNYISIGSLCHYAQVLGHSLTYGGKPVPDFERIGTALVWGANPAVSSPRMFTELRKAVRQGIKLVVVDPVLSETAELAHMHLPVRPGSDGFLALAFLKHAIEEKHLKPKDDMEVGWSDLAQVVAGLSYRELLQKTDIGETQFSEANALIFDNLPGWTRVGLGLEHRPGGVQTIRATSCLQSILDPDNRPAHMAAPLKPLPCKDRYPQLQAPIGAQQTPLFTKGRREGQGMLLNHAILHDDPYPVRAMLIAGGNPMVTFPSLGRQEQALKRLDFLAVFDLFMTPTARLADLVIPGADQLDNMELVDYGRGGIPFLGLMRPASSSPKGLPTWRLIFELAARFGLRDLFPWDDNREALAYRVSGTNLKFSDLEESGSSTARYGEGKPSSRQWHTSDGKVHYRSHALESKGRRGMPTPEALALPAETDDEFPLWLSTGDRVMAYQHGQFRGIPAYENLHPEPILEVHPETANRLGIQSGELVTLSTKYGKIDIRAGLSKGMRQDCLRMTHGWETANANELTGLDHLDRISGFPWLRAIPAYVKRKATGT